MSLKLTVPSSYIHTTKCANISKAEIRAKIRVDFRGKGDNTSDSKPDLIEEEYHRSADRYFYRFRYDTSLQSFSEAKKIATQSENSLFEECESCAFNRVRCEANHQPLRILNWNKKQKAATGFIYKGTRYQLKDFIYFISKPTSGSKEPHPYSIGQIQNIKVTCLKSQPCVKLTVDNYERYDDHFRLKRSEETEMNIPFATHDNRRVFRWNSKLLNPKDLDGHCFVRHIEQIEDLNIYKDLDDTFWVQEYIPHDLEKNSITAEDLELMPKKDLTFLKGNEKRLERERKQEMSKMDGAKLNTLDIFSGAGGFSQGLHESGVIGISYAIESDTAACKTFRRNFEDAIVYNCDAGKFLELAMKIEDGVGTGISLDDNGDEMSKIPLRGDIDMIIGGPPCQGWSKVNRQNNPKKIQKNPICPMRESIATYLSYVEFYRPKYCLLENVTGLKYHPLNGSDIPNCSSDEGLLTSGAIKFIFRVLTCLGYQCQYATLQAGAYGVPSSRNRVIIWASLPGYKLPKYPEPTNVFNRIPKDAPYTRRSAPHRPLTIQHCTSDLPLWEFKNPHKEIQQTAEQESSQINRGKTIAQYPILKHQKLVGLEKQDYASPHLCEFQRQARKSVPDQLLHNHVTGRISAKQAERVCSIPLIAGADYRRMNEELLSNNLRKESERCRENVDYRNRKLEGRYGRLSENETFKIITTGNDQYSTNSWMLNPNLHRPYTIREIARAMGFSDSFIWDLETTKVSDALKQIGNAVPPPIARALGNELRKVLQGRDISRENEDDEDVVDQEYIAIGDQADQNLDMVKETLAGSETDSDEEIDDLIIAQLEREFNRSTGDKTDTGSEEEDEKNSDTDKEVSDDRGVDIDAYIKDQEDQEDLESDNEDEENWNTDEKISSKGDDDPESKDKNAQNLDIDAEISNESEAEVDEDLQNQENLEPEDKQNWNATEELSDESELEVDEDSEDQEGQEKFESDDEGEQNLDTDEEMSGSDVDVDEDMKDQDDLVSADEEDMNENMDSEEEFLINMRIQRKERINNGRSRADAIVIDGSE
ncbi:putative s-adenosyl-l-methionine-dependent methyltransferase protein [Botrytis fragariae]|uniref:Cytosine-specific methyltransferase n=1 Tax=Botrytis fragariae TaxID=1964551 RepID=A0A8H6AKJ2_9HELO|nr:putative s-adenosyl-l-methionine-dependent methyltransferase protein [Botrytis fragariae]KAF5869059.1 putative s-adenosyl-l-methionine-dependent methyltransferase protein [Botrytis fragariae]